MRSRKQIHKRVNEPKLSKYSIDKEPKLSNSSPEKDFRSRLNVFYRDFNTSFLSLGVLFTLGVSIYLCVLIDTGYHFNSNSTSSSSIHHHHENSRIKYYIRSIILEKLNFSSLAAPYSTNKNITHDYDGLFFHPVVSWNVGRVIQDSSHLKGHVWDIADGQDDVDYYYAFDDDYVREPFCTRVSWYRDLHPNCNNLHEMLLFNISIINGGYYRDVSQLKDDFSGEDIIIKTIKTETHDYDYIMYDNIRIDALVMERLTSSPRIANMFGHCGLSVVQEYFIQDIEPFAVPGSGMMYDVSLNDTDDVKPQNDFIPTEKLNLALNMGEAIAALHGFPDGVIVHDDIQICQFLFNTEGQLKLNDFNRAEIMLWDEKNQKYCKYRNGAVYGNFRAIEEMRDDVLDEKIDVWSFGNIVYGLLTGLWVFYDVDDEVAQVRILDGETAYIDERYRTRSYAEGALVKVIESCWIHDPDNRSDIFEIVEYLRNATEINEIDPYAIA